MLTIKINQTDNVAVALSDLAAGTVIESGVTLTEEVKRGHKIALTGIAAGQPVIKYGMRIGNATADIKPGSKVHTHNLKTALGGVEEYSYNPQFDQVKTTGTERTFDGFIRPDGNAGVRNNLWIIPSVGCVNKLAENLAKAINRKLPHGSVDRAIALAHPYGCSQLGGDHATTQKLLAGLVKHPNAGGVLVVGLGCENNTLDSFKKVLGTWDENRVRFLIAQEAEDEFAAGLELLEELLEYAAAQKRQPIPLAKLKVGLKCGGSDGFSGITANPLVGAFSDLLIAAGGTSVLTEVPEMFGAETLLMNRCRNREIFDKCVGMINNFKQYFISHNQVVYENPSPGNKEGGISTLEDKSLGCTQKGGSSPVVDVLEYGDTLHTPGLNLLTGPGNDMVATTVLAAAGAQIVLFTTGRGTPFGGPIPTVKIATNNELARKKTGWIDFNAGQIIDGKPMAELSGELLDYVIELASGRLQARNEEHGYEEIAIFKDGVTL